jgi:hypothetical protein
VYPGLTELVTDMVGGGSDAEDPQLYRVKLPPECVGMSTIELATVMRADHHANVLAVSRNGKTVGNPPHGFRMEPTDDLVVLAFSLGDLEPVEDVGAVPAEDAEPSAPPVGGAQPATA